MPIFLEPGGSNDIILPPKGVGPDGVESLRVALTWARLMEQGMVKHIYSTKYYFLTLFTHIHHNYFSLVSHHQNGGRTGTRWRKNIACSAMTLISKSSPLSWKGT